MRNTQHYSSSVFIRVMLSIRNLNVSYDLIIIFCALQMKLATSALFQTQQQISSSDVKMFGQFQQISH